MSNMVFLQHKKSHKLLHPIKLLVFTDTSMSIAFSQRNGSSSSNMTTALVVM